MALKILEQKGGDNSISSSSKGEGKVKKKNNRWVCNIARHGPTPAFSFFLSLFLLLLQLIFILKRCSTKKNLV
jgi:hypothetical protein